MDDRIKKVSRAYLQVLGLVPVEEQKNLSESHFKSGDKVECIKSGMTGTVVGSKGEGEGEVYTVELDNGKKMEYSADELKAVTNEALDPVDAKELKGKHKDRKDKDIDNDGDVDSSDEYLHKKRQAIAKAMKKESVDEEAQPKWKVQIGNKHYMVTARNTAEANKKAQAMAHKDGNHGVGGKIEKMQEETSNIKEGKAPGATADLEPSDATRDTFDKQLSTRKGEKDFVNQHKVEAPEFVDAEKVNAKTFKSFTKDVNTPKKRWNDQNVGDKKPVKNDGK